MNSRPKIFTFTILLVGLFLSACGSSTTPAATRTPGTAVVKTPGVLDCPAIVQAHKNSTPEGWETVKTSFRGREIYYTGKVSTVTETNVVHMTGSLCHATLHQVPLEIAINLSKGQYIEGYGTILNINYYLGEDVDVQVNPEQIFVR